MELALHSSMKRFLALSIAILSVVGAGSLSAAQSTQPAAARTRPAQAGQTADEQSQTKPDLALVQRIRQAIVKDKTLSVAAHNCKVITQKGHVRLRGQVESDEEKTRVEAIATKIAGTGKVTNELTIKSAS
jgi:hyperosmotically inducible periplasmic protein